MIITSVQQQKNNQQRKSVFVDGKYTFSVDDENCFKLDLHEGKEITEKEISYIENVCNFSKAKKKALNAITRKRFTEYELKEKLKFYGYDDETIERVIEYLRELDYLNDTVYVEKFIKDSLNLKKIGTKRIIFELEQKGIHRNIIEDVLELSSINEVEILKPLVDRKLQKLKMGEDTTKMINYFLRKGYSISSIKKALEEIKIEE